jgi:hypothetical protein
LKPVDGKSSAETPKRKGFLECIKDCQIHSRVQAFFAYLCASKGFSISILICIVLNTLILALDSHPIDPYNQAVYENINTVLTWIFFGEMIIKILGLGVVKYVLDRVNIFDALIVLLTVAENIVDVVVPPDQFTSKGAISGFRAIRLFKIFKVA